MKTSTIVRSPGALALGIFFTGVTAFTIFNDVWHGAPFTVAHLNAAAALVAAIAAGHMALPALWRGEIGPALGLAIIFVASTGYIVTSAGARNAEASQAKASAVVKANAERDAARKAVAEAERDLEKAKTDLELAKADAAAEIAAAAKEYKTAKDAAAKECATGGKTKCDGKNKTRDAANKDVDAAEARAATKRSEYAKALEKAESHAALKRAELSIMGPEEKPFAGYHHAAAVFEAAGLGTASVIEARLELLLPFVLVVISEVGTLVFLSMALGHRDNTGNLPEAAKTAATVRAKFGNDNVCPPPKGGNRTTVAAGNSRTVACKAAAEADVIRLVARGEQLPSQDTLAARWGVHKGTASKWLTDFERRGLVVRHREGRAKRVAAA